MKKALTLGISVAFASMILMSPAMATVPVGAKSPEQAVKGFFDAEMSNDIDSMVTFAQDTRFYSENDERAFYQQSLASYPLTSYKIVNRTKLSPDHEVFTVNANYSKTVLPSNTLSYDVVKQNDGTWKIVIKRVVIDGKKNSPTFGKIINDNRKIIYDNAPK